MKRLLKAKKELEKIFNNHNAKFNLIYEDERYITYMLLTKWGRVICGMDITPRRKNSFLYFNFRDAIPLSHELPEVPINRFNGKLNLFWSDSENIEAVNRYCNAVFA